MVAEGVLPEGHRLPGDRLLYGLYDVFGESVPFIALAARRRDRDERPLGRGDSPGG